jgi:ABC-type sugar transport system substrate-binding protein
MTLIPSSARRGRRGRLIGAVTALVLLSAACGTDDSAEQDSGPAASGTPVPTDENGRPQLSDSYSAQIAAAAGVTVDTSKFKTEGPYRIAAVVQGPTNGWGTIFDAVMRDAFEQSGKVEDLLYVPWDFATENQVKGIDDAIAADVDAIMLTSLSRAGLSAAVDRAADAGIPVINCMAGVETDSFTAEVSRDIPLMGYATAKQVAEEVGGRGKVVMLHGIAGVDAAEFWKSGAAEAFGEYPDIEIVSEQYGNWSAADAVDVMRTVIAQEGDIDAVWVGGLEMGPAVIDAFSEAGRDVPFIGGTNPTNGFLRLATERDLNFFVAPFPPAASQLCADTVLKVLAGESVPRYQDVADVMEGTQPYGDEDTDKWYVEEFNDDFIGPKVADDAVYVEAGFER